MLSKQSEDCIFCKIIRGEIPSYKIYEDDEVYSFLDINPTSKGHCLVVPKEHIESFQDVNPSVIDKIKKVSSIILKAVGTTDWNLVQNNGKFSGQVVPHIHFHIVPRFENDKAMRFTQRKLEKEEAMEILSKIEEED